MKDLERRRKLLDTWHPERERDRQLAAHPDFLELLEIRSLIGQYIGGHTGFYFCPEEDQIRLECFYHDLDGPEPNYPAGKLVKKDNKWWYEGKEIVIMEAMEQYYKNDEVMSAVYSGLVRILSARYE
ncbi:MAG: hypothetical protein ABH849_04175 [Nanoarchaeota archaeon]